MSKKIWDFSFRRFGVNFHYKLFRSPGDRLLVFFPALRRAGLENVMFYNRLTWESDFDCSCLYLADPALQFSSEVRGGWFQGRPEYFTVERMALDLSDIIKEFRFDPAKTLLYGSSQGGYGALAVGAHMGPVKVLAECPQTRLRYFNLVADINRMAKYCYDSKDGASIPEKYEVRVDLARLYAARKPTSIARIIVKDSDTHCIKVHTDPFMSAVGASANVTCRHIPGDLGGAGHSPLPQEFVRNEIMALFADEPAPGTSAVPAAATG
ncbi:MAG: hypothetical protein AB7O57_03160 [Hyphomicrobiaceae bacterium]